MPTLQRLRLHVVVLVMLVATIGVVLPATADPVLPEEQRLADIRAKIATVRQEISAAKATKHRDAVSFANAQRQLAVVMNALAAAEQAVQRQQQAVDKARVRLATLRAREAQQRGVMADRAVTLYKRGGMDSLTTVLGSDSATHALRRSAYVDAVNRADARSVQRVMSTQTAVDAQRIQLRVEQEALQRVAAEQRHRAVLVFLRVELGHLLLVARVGDHEICVRTVDQPGAGANELVTVVGQQLEVDEDIDAPRR